jgi:hypothetical protein
MSYRSPTSALARAAALMATTSGVRAADDAKYPHWKGQWTAIVTSGLIGTQFKFDPTKAAGAAQQAPLTPEYQKVHEDSMADQARGGLGNYPTARCLPGGMPRTMASRFLEFIITQDTTYILAGIDILDNRRIYTDGRDWPTDALPTSMGYSIGKWIDETGSGHFDVLELDTRGPFRGPRAYDSSGLPLHFDNQSTFKERLYLDNSDPNILHDEITVIDHALTRPWSVDKTFRRNSNPRPNWRDKYLHRRQQPNCNREGKLSPPRGRPFDARQEGSAAARFAIFRAAAEMMPHWLAG